MQCQFGCCEHAVHGSRHRRRCGAIRQSTMLPQHVEDRAIGCGRAVWEAMSLIVGHLLLGDLLDKFVQEARFAHTGSPMIPSTCPWPCHPAPGGRAGRPAPAHAHIARQRSTSPPGTPPRLCRTPCTV